MTYEEVLQILYERSMQRIFEMSANYAMTIPKKGFEVEFEKERQIADWLKEKMNEKEK